MAQGKCEEGAKGLGSFEHLPQECILYIFSFLTPKSVVMLGGSCNSMHQLSQDDKLWKLFWNRLAPPSFFNSKLTFMENYKARPKPEKIFFELLYEWVSELDKNDFKKLALDAIHRRPRYPMIERAAHEADTKQRYPYLVSETGLTNREILIRIFVIDDKLLNSTVIECLLTRMINDLSQNGKLAERKYSIVLENDHYPLFYSSAGLNAKVEQSRVIMQQRQIKRSF